MVITMVENIVAEAVMAVEITALLHATIFVRIHARRNVQKHVELFVQILVKAIASILTVNIFLSLMNYEKITNLYINMSNHIDMCYSKS